MFLALSSDTREHTHTRAHIHLAVCSGQAKCLRIECQPYVSFPGFTLATPPVYPPPPHPMLRCRALHRQMAATVSYDATQPAATLTSLQRLPTQRSRLARRRNPANVFLLRVCLPGPRLLQRRKLFSTSAVRKLLVPFRSGPSSQPTCRPAHILTHLGEQCSQHQNAFTWMLLTLSF